jgi:hypothetical protein
MRRREFITLLGGAAVGWPLATRGQQTERIWRVGVLDTTTAERNATNYWHSNKRCLTSVMSKAGILP